MWPPSGVLAAILIVLGIVLLVAYAVRRGFVHEALPDALETAQVPTDGPSPAAEPAHRARTLGAVGAIALAAGLLLGVATAAGGWAGAGTGASGADCAQSWNGCPQVTPPASAP